MKILVTGATGFIGNHVINYLLDYCPEVEIIASSATPENAKTFPWYQKVEYKPFNINSANSDLNIFYFFNQPTHLIHLAWEGLPNYKDLFHFEKNLFHQYFFLKNLIENGLKDITLTGTCFEYGMKEGCLEESATAQPSNPYALAKNTLRVFLEELNNIKQFDLKWIRLFYMYGNGQNSNSLISQLEKAVHSGDKKFNMSAGEQVRDYLPIEKVAEYIVKITLQNQVTGIINCCSGRPIKVKDFVYEYLEKINKTISLNLGYFPYPDYEPMCFWGNNQKLMKIISNS